MTWDEIMLINNPNDALMQIHIKVCREDISVAEMEMLISKYMKTHGITLEEMAYYPNGESVIGNL